MKLIGLKIKNFRAYKDESFIEFDKKFTSFIGRNDVGKSTVFDALDIYFGNKKPDISDLSVNADEKSIEFTCIFSELPSPIEIDTTAKTELSEEYLLNEDSNLEIKKIYKCTDKTVSTTPEIYISANYPSSGQVPFLHSMNQTQLKEYVQKNNISVSSLKENNILRKSIWNSINELKLEKTNLKIEDFEIKSKRIYSKIEDEMPLFFAFRSDREMTDADAEAKDPMQIAVTEAQQQFEDQIKEIESKIQQKVKSIATLALEKLKEIDPRLANQLNPVLKSKPSWKFDYKIEDERGVALNKRGSGTRRLVLLNFFRAQAEKKGDELRKGIIYAIEEPETSQHPKNQKMIIDALVGLTNDSSRQIMITTHSAELLKNIETSFADGIRFLQSDTDNTRDIISGSDALILAADSLGTLAKQKFGSAEKIVLVEGKSDCLFLEHTAEEMKKVGEITGNLFELKVEVLPVGGCGGVKDWILDNRHSVLGLDTFVFLDSDRVNQSDPPTSNETFVTSLNQNGNVKKAFYTKKREIENYIDNSLTSCSVGDYDDAKTIISPMTNIAQNKLIDKFWTRMNSSMIDNEIKDIIKQIISL